MQELKSMRNDALQSKLAGAGHGDGEGDVDENEEPPKKIRRSVEQCVDIDVHGQSVTILCPAKRALVADVMVLMDAKMLAAVFKFLQPDCLGGQEKRTYKKDGLHSKGLSKEGEWLSQTVWGKWACTAMFLQN